MVAGAYSQDMKLTHTNLHVLARTFRTSEVVPARVDASAHPHLKRCIALGLARVDGDSLVLTDEGKARIAAGS